MNLNIQIKDGNFNLVVQLDDCKDFDTLISHLAPVISELKTASEEARAVVVDTQPNNKDSV